MPSKDHIPLERKFNFPLFFLDGESTSEFDRLNIKQMGKITLLWKDDAGINVDFVVPEK